MNAPDRVVFSRRGLFGLAAAALAASAVPAAERSAASKHRPIPKRPLGNTGLLVSEIGFGGVPIDDPAVLHHALDRGINYVDTSDDYRNGQSEEVIGEVVRKRRSEIVLATKIHPWKNTPKVRILADAEACLRRLKTDVIDVLQVHQVGKASGGQSVERLENPALLEAFSELRRAGKVRFFGVTGHDGDLMDVFSRVLREAESGAWPFRTMLMRYNPLDYARQEVLIARARKLGVGTIAMKTLAGAKDADLRKFRGGSTFRQSALRWVLSNPHLSGAIISISSKEQVDEYAEAAGSPVTAEDLRMLSEYAARHGREVCRSCNDCEPACPDELPIADILRYGMYAEGYDDRSAERGRRAYSELPRKPESCVSCAAPCVPRCEYGLDVRSLVVRAASRLARNAHAT